MRTVYIHFDLDDNSLYLISYHNTNTIINTAISNIINTTITNITNTIISNIIINTISNVETLPVQKTKENNDDIRWTHNGGFILFASRSHDIQLHFRYLPHLLFPYC